MRFGRYETEAEIGRGGMAVVFRARDPAGETVAVKVLATPLDPELLATFERETRLLATLRSNDGVVPILDSGSAGGRPFIVMPLLTGGTLRDRMDRKKTFERAEAVALVRRLAEALGRAHERGIVHRDVKPGNILFDADATPLVADLGFAKHFRRDVPGASQSATVSARGTIAGTPGYMAPEQLQGDQPVGPEADIFALGVILYECLAGEKPFPALGLVSYVESLRAITPRLRGHPAWLAAAVEQALEKDPARRFHDGHALARALTPRDGSTGLRAAALGGALALVALTVVVFAWPARRPPSSTEKQVFPTKTREPTAVELADKAQSALGRYDIAAAAAFVSSALALDPSCATALRVSGGVKIFQFDRDGAARDLARATELAKSDALAWALLAQVTSGHAALAAAERAVELDGSLAAAYRARGFARLNTSAKDEAGMSDIEHALQLAPDDILALSVRAGQRAELGDREGAIADSNRLVDVAPKLPFAWAARSRIRHLLGLLQPALEDVERAVELAPRAKWLRDAAGLRAEMGDVPGALRDATRCIELEPGAEEGWTFRASLEMDLGRLDDALRDLDRAVANNPESQLARGERAVVHLRRGHPELALEDAEKAIALGPQSAQGWTALGDAHAGVGRVDEAIKDFEKALELGLDPGNAEIARERIAKLRASRGH